MVKAVTLITLLLYTGLMAFGQQKGHLTGLVRDRGSNPIDGASIFLTPGQAGSVTDGQGRFGLNNIPSGNYTLSVSYIGYKSDTSTLGISANQVSEIVVTLERDSIVLTGLTVTAQKRSENSKEVPIALTNVSGGFIENSVVESMGALSSFVPGVQVQEQSALFPGFVIRGLTSDVASLNVDNRVSVFQDGVSASKQVGAYSEFFDVDRVEVLKGPQGTLFGRSAQIGAIHLITRHAKNETSGNFTLGTGNYNQMRANGYINLPLIKNKLFVRVAGIYNNRDGYIKNLSGGTLMGKNTIASRTSFKYLPGKNSVFDLIVNYQHDRNPGQDFKSGTFAPKGGDLSPYSFADLGSGRNDQTDKRDLYTITTQYKQYFNDGLSLTAITGYRTLAGTSVFDGDGTKAQALDFMANAHYTQFSQEVRFNLDKQYFSGFAGANYFHEYGNVNYLVTMDERSFFAILSPLLASKIKGFKIIPLIIDGEPNLALSNNPLTGKPFQTLHTESNNDNGVNNHATDIFADGTCKLTPHFKITAGGRMIFENQSTFYRVDPSPGSLGFLLGKGVNNLFKPTVGRLDKSKYCFDWVGRFVMQYDFSREVTLYASLSKGRRPNVVQIDADTTEYLRSEIVNNYEIGIKNLLFDNRLQFNVGSFIYDYCNFQTSSADINGGGLYRFIDSGKATGKGIEAELNLAATKSLTVFANYAFLDARFNAKNSDGKIQQLAGNTFRLTPKQSGSAGFSYQFGLRKSGVLTFNLNATYKSGFFFDDQNTPGLYQGAYALLNTALLYTSKNGRYGFRLNMSNMTNKHFLIDAGNTGQTFGIPTFVPGTPRFYGVQFFVNL
jgi:outer membrane receptor protein involved in Fe transport